eukprot:Selendium_serpulae@DN5178_c0_g1_i1.p2
MPANQRIESLIELVQQLSRTKVDLERQASAAQEALVAAVGELAVQLQMLHNSPSPEADGGAPPPPPPMPRSRRHIRALRFGNSLPETTYGSPSRRSRRGTIEKHEGGVSLGKRPIVARSTGPRLSQPMRHQKRPIN